MQIKRPYTTVNTFSRRPCLNQIFSYLIFILDNLSFWLTIQNHYTSEISKFTMMALFTISVVLLLVFGCLTSSCDPADPIMTQYRNGNTSMYSLQRFSIDNDQLYLYCQHCDSYVRQTSKHCKLCDRQEQGYYRCVDVFDHHCIWINNCIGKWNYKVFIAMIIAAQMHLLLYVTAVGLLWTEGLWGQFLAEMILNWIILAVVIVFSLLLLALVILHFYLIARNITTFQFMTRRKNPQINPAQEPVKQSIQTSSNEINNKFKESIISQNNGSEEIHRSTQFLQQTPFKTADKDASKEQEEPPFEHFKESRLQIMKASDVVRAKSQMDRRTDLQIQTNENILKDSRAFKLLIGNGLKIKSMRNSVSSKGLRNKDKQLSISNRSEEKNSSELGVKYNEKFQNINVIFQQ